MIRSRKLIRTSDYSHLSKHRVIYGYDSFEQVLEVRHQVWKSCLIYKMNLYTWWVDMTVNGKMTNRFFFQWLQIMHSSCKPEDFW